MDHTIEETVKIYLDWDCENGRWEVAGATLDGHPLDPLDGPIHSNCPCMETTDDGRPNTEHDQMLALTLATPLPTGIELFDLLSAAMARPSSEVSPGPAYGTRPPSPALVDMVDGAVKQVFGEVDDFKIRRLNAKLLPIFRSVDENAQLRGEAAGRAQVKG